jgi:predicted ATP-grasp superfamily ATP-dependent carboligase
MNLTHDFTQALGDWLANVKPKSALLLASIPGVETDKEHEIMTVSTDAEVGKKIQELKLKKMEEGVLSGLSSALMLKCFDTKVPATSVMVETNYVPDVLASVTLLEIMGKILDIQVDSNELKNAGKQIEDKFKKNMKQLKKGREDLKEMHEDTMYR